MIVGSLYDQQERGHPGTPTVCQGREKSRAPSQVTWVMSEATVGHARGRGRPAGVQKGGGRLLIERDVQDCLKLPPGQEFNKHRGGRGSLLGVILGLSGMARRLGRATPSSRDKANVTRRADAGRRSLQTVTSCSITAFTSRTTSTPFPANALRNSTGRITRLRIMEARSSDKTRPIGTPLSQARVGRKVSVLSALLDDRPQPQARPIGGHWSAKKRQQDSDQ
jgi:hypothetical protein